MAGGVGRYFQIATFRIALAVLAILVAIRALHVVRGDGPVWLLTSILASGAAAALIWPLVVPAPNRAMSVYSLAHAFFLAGMFLLPPGALVLTIAFAISLAGLVHGARAYRTVFHLSSSMLVFAGFALTFALGPRPSDFMFQPAPRAGLEILIGAAALVALLIVRSVALRLEMGEKAPHWGAFQGPAIFESALVLLFSVSITVMVRIHLALVTVVFAEMGTIWWFLQRYHAYASGVRPVRRPARARAVRQPARANAGAPGGVERRSARPILRRTEPPAAASEANRTEPDTSEETWAAERKRRIR
jgi:hypothetical protein